ncbi:hypothetical protein FP76_gp184 [Bacillus phage Evoli]|uniref:Uncharacterized protein n=1 Tax=Bacillus phage Evoli TaxID=1486658 RepID=A0A024B0D5_9CAUD|nr:hypothetical protein FP76_gp184 [Bacillus phage Evoli]AHZ09910.1 hypothetical protein [Bacillus phage Evoli]
MQMVKRWLQYTGHNQDLHPNLTKGKVYETHRIEYHSWEDGYLDITPPARYYGWSKGTYFIMDDNDERLNIYVTGVDYKNNWKCIKQEKLDYCTNPDPMFKTLLERGRR